MIQKIFKDILNKAIEDKKINYWVVNSLIMENFNIYAVNDYEIESELKSKRVQSQVTVYKNFDDKIGKSSFTVFESGSVEEFEKELDDAIFICTQSLSEKYELPKSSDDVVNDEHIDYNDFYSKKFFDDFESEKLEEFGIDKIGLLKNIVQDSQDNENNIKVMLNSLEFFNKIKRYNIETSSGISKSYNKNTSYFELILTAINTKTQDEKEHIAYENINDIYSYDFAKFFKDTITFTKDTLIAKEAVNFDGQIVLSDVAAKDFFVPEPPTNPVVNQSSGKLKFLKISQFEKGKEIFKTNYDKLTMYSNPFVKNNIDSVPCDGLGISSNRLCLIKDNVFMNFYSTKQYSDYLGIKATGPLGVVEVNCGKKSVSELVVNNDENKKLIEIVSFAWFSPDTISGNFSAEIRLGYEIIDGVKTPFRGGLFTGNVFKVLEDVEFSKEQVEMIGYLGPAVIKFHKSKIVGM